VRFTRNHQVVKRFAANRADQALDVAVLPRRARRNWVIAYTHGTNAPGVRRPERAIAVTNQVARSSVPRDRLGDLPCDPLSRRVCGEFVNAGAKVHQQAGVKMHQFGPVWGCVPAGTFDLAGPKERF